MKNENNSIKEIWDKLENSKNVLMTLHPFPDGDSLGSCVAMKKLLEDKGKNVYLVSRDPIDENFHEFEFTKEVNFSGNIENIGDSEYDCVLFLDHGNFDEYFYKKETIDKFSGDERVVNIDHHSTNPFFGNLNYVKEDAVSTCTVLIDAMKEMNEEIDSEIAERLLIGISADSRFFSYGNFEKIFSDVAFLCGKGADYKKILKNILENTPYKMKKLEGEILRNMELREISGKKVAGSFIDKEFIEKHDLSMAEIRRGISWMRDTKGVLVIFTLSEIEKGLKGSLRCKESEEYFDVSKVAKEFNGGGHAHASAFLIENYSSIKEALERVFNSLSKHL